MEREYAMFGGGMPVKAPNRYSQQSRYSDTVPLRRHSPAIKPRSTSQNSGHRNNANHYYHGRYRVQGIHYCSIHSILKLFVSQSKTKSIILYYTFRELENWSYAVYQ